MLVGLPIYRDLDKHTPLHDHIYQVYKRGGTVCGGYPRYCTTFSPSKDDSASDIDIYPKDKRSFEEIIGYFNSLREFSGYLKEQTDYPGKPDIYEGLLQLKTKVSWKNRKIQVVKQFGTPEEIIRTFDFTVCQAYLDPIDMLIHVTNEFVKDQEAKELRFSHQIIPNPLDTGGEYSYRIDRYRSKGYRATYGLVLDCLKGIKPTEWKFFIEMAISQWGKDFLIDKKLKEKLQFIGELQTI